MSEQDKEFLACLCVWLDWNVYQSVRSMSDDFTIRQKSFEDIKIEANKLVREFTESLKNK